MVNITPETTEQARRVYTYIALNPKIFEMNSWFSVEGYEPNEHAEAAVIDLSANVCNTTMCLAGTQVFLSGGKEALKRLAEEDIDMVADATEMNRAAAAFGLSPDEGYDLFVNTNNEQAFEIISGLARGSAEEFYEVFPDYRPSEPVDTSV
jgi:hypothetical protein